MLADHPPPERAGEPPAIFEKPPIPNKPLIPDKPAEKPIIPQKPTTATFGKPDNEVKLRKTMDSKPIPRPFSAHVSDTSRIIHFDDTPLQLDKSPSEPLSQPSSNVSNLQALFEEDGAANSSAVKPSNAGRPPVRSSSGSTTPRGTSSPNPARFGAGKAGGSPGNAPKPTVPRPSTHLDSPEEKPIIPAKPGSFIHLEKAEIPSSPESKPQLPGKPPSRMPDRPLEDKPAIPSKPGSRIQSESSPGDQINSANPQNTSDKPASRLSDNKPPIPGKPSNLFTEPVSEKPSISDEASHADAVEENVEFPDQKPAIPDKPSSLRESTKIGETDKPAIPEKPSSRLSDNKPPIPEKPSISL